MKTSISYFKEIYIMLIILEVYLDLPYFYTKINILLLVVTITSVSLSYVNICLP